MAKRNKLWYKQPAKKWEEALPLGNGRMGAMIFGGVRRERLQLNEDTLWAGYPVQEDNPAAAASLPEARLLLAEGRYAEAQQLVERSMLGSPGQGVQPYQPLGDLFLDFAGEPDERDYVRSLDLNTAAACIEFGAGERRQRRTAFISAADQVMLVRIESADPAGLEVAVSIGSELRHGVQAASDGTLLLTGECPLRVQNHNNGQEPAVIYDEERPGRPMRFAALVRVFHEGGVLHAEDGRLTVSGAKEITLLYTSATSFDGPGRAPGLSGRDPEAVCRSVMRGAEGKSFDELLAAHARDYQALFERVELRLGAPQRADNANLPTDERLRRIMDGAQDPDMLSLIFQYGRYLLISSSRPGTQAANLQGIWNDKVQPPWNCDYHFNINLQMNYWLAETCHLSECHEPLFDLIGQQAVTGAETARIQYGCRGWTAHTMSDLWRTNNVGPSGDAQWAYWPMAGAWLCRHLWEHYLFAKDIDFLKQRAWPLIREAARFLLDWLVADEAGRLITSPSTSPENSFIVPGADRYSSVSRATAMDITLCRELFGIVIEASGELGAEEAFAETCREARSKLPPLQIGAKGQLMEWDRDVADADPKHRHLSHLYGLYPGSELTVTGTPEYTQAARRSLEIRGNEGTGWSMGWKVALWARLGDGEQAVQVLNNFLSIVDGEGFDYHRGGMYPNLLCAHPPFQIDGNFGSAAGIAEMLLQSHEQDIHLLPALPAEWAEGRVSGLRARGGYTVSIVWAGGRLTEASVTADFAGKRKVRCRGHMLDIDFSAGVPVAILASAEGNLKIRHGE
ncbi:MULTISPECIES: glycoside hydrolase family 95 protein [Paenibacillus]|uniref:Alpha/beta hydrolase n=1 Tax=Paenibacillus albilobatus TaxID=2716884 RepID=A0A919XLP1_9BACL|nr:MULTISPECIES: glycoside hydrolase family 95 protein [Paenibacillus]GIO32478.1 alpha/beta hydrolase [Paenibacillus albilobatus]